MSRLTDSLHRAGCLLVIGGVLAACTAPGEVRAPVPAAVAVAQPEVVDAAQPDVPDAVQQPAAAAAIDAAAMPPPPAPPAAAADPVRRAPALHTPYDPWERWNRRVHAVNNALDRRVIRPVALGYVRAVPTPVRNGIGNFFRNLGGPVNTVNAALQGKPAQAGASLFRFLVNSTFGLGGLFDVATRWRIPDRSEDFGQTLAKWGWTRSRYVELPLFGPRTVRDIVGLAGDARLNPLPTARSATGQSALQAIQVVNVRTQLLSTDAMREDAQDDYRLFRDAWWQRRAYQIWQEDVEATNAELPDYLLLDPEDEASPPEPRRE